MDENTKIITMKDDLEEIKIEKELSSSSRISAASQQKVSLKTSPVSVAANDDKKTDDLKNLEDNQTQKEGYSAASNVATDEAKSKPIENVPTLEEFFSEPVDKKDAKKAETGELPKEAIEEKEREEQIKPISEVVGDVSRQEVSQGVKIEEKENEEMKELKELMEKIAKRNIKVEDSAIKADEIVQPSIVKPVEQSKEFARKMAEKNAKISDLEAINEDAVQSNIFKPIEKPMEQEGKGFIKPVVKKPARVEPNKAMESEQALHKSKDEISKEDIALLEKIQERLYGINQEYSTTDKYSPTAEFESKEEPPQPIQKEKFEAIKRKLQGTQEIATAPSAEIEKKLPQPIREIEKDSVKYALDVKTAQDKIENISEFTESEISAKKEEKISSSAELYKRPLAKTLNKLEESENGNKPEDLKKIVDRIAKISNREEQLLEKIEKRLQGLEEKPDTEVKKEASAPSQIEKQKSIMDRFHKIEQAFVKPSAEIKKEEVKQTQDEKAKVDQDNYIRKRTIESKDFFKKIKEEKNKEARDMGATGKLQSVHAVNTENTSGIIKKEEYSKSEKPIKKKGYITIDNYVPPEQRLIHGKQELYSSMKKKIGQKSGKENLDKLKNLAETKQQENLSEKEEKARLRRRIRQEYHLETSVFPIKKVISVVVAVVLIVSVALGGYYLWNLWSKDSGGGGIGGIIDTAPPGEELEEFKSVNDFIEVRASKLKDINSFDRETQVKFDSDSDMYYFRIIIKNNSGKILSFEEALKIMGFETSKFPDKFMGLTENEYIFMAFRTQNNTKRLGFAIKLKDSGKMNNLMTDWEGEKEKMKSALSRLFMSDQTSDIARSSFDTGNYRNITTIRYIHIPDRNSSLNYFIYNNILVFATSRDNIERMAKILLGE